MSQKQMIEDIKKINDQNRIHLEKMIKDHEVVKEMATWFVNQYEYALTALTQLAMFETPDSLRKADMGLPSEEIIEMAYDNMRQYAQDSVNALQGNYRNFPHPPSQE